jgi:hypothetical protein
MQASTTFVPARDESFVPFSFGAQFLGLLWLPAAALVLGVTPSVIVRYGGPEFLAGPARMGAVIAVSLVALWVITSPVGVRVGLDGLVVRHIYGWRAFISYSELAAVTESQGHFVVLKLWNDASLRFYMWMPRAGCVARRMEWARSTFATASSSWLSSAGHLLPGSRSTSAWVRDLRGLGSRGAPQDLESFWSVLENPGAPPVARAAAAVALASAITPQGELRLRRSAESCASPTLRDALVRATDHDDEAAIAGALRQLRREANWLPETSRS